MNGRMEGEDTPECRLAAVARSLAIQMEKKKRGRPDYKDFCDALRPYVLKELIIARIAEQRLVDEQPEGASRWTRLRLTDLLRELRAAEAALPKDLCP